MAKKYSKVVSCFACGKTGHLALTRAALVTTENPSGKQYVCPLWRGYGNVVPPIAKRCGYCGASGFSYSNGQEYAKDGTRGYRCMTCGNIKPEK